ncbi:MAG TPA: AMP-binding protein [Nocardioides sp.]|uniref:class I adenylate-forming enzyme family protein n=1 Tax=Nocardioides sp. TaxID=35761 RepID=UPI002E380171|nr:AMP-binding protein [Nocardioides sp.]HEX3931157.1 AMP-binding protein [Nocardioides sp.]
MTAASLTDLRDSRMLHRFLRIAAQEHPDRVALSFQGREHTYLELEERANALAHRLVEAGLGPGRRGAVVISNRPEWIVATHAVLKTGAAVVTPMATWTLSELEHVLGLTAPDVVVAETLSATTLTAYDSPALRLCVDHDAPQGWTDIADLIDQRSADPVSVVVDDEQEAFLFLSSGTTGLPKAVRHSHRSMSAIVHEWIWQAGLNGDDRVQFFLPACTIFGMSTMLSSFSTQSRISFFQRFNLDVMLHDVEESRITVGMAAAPIAVAMAAHPDLERFDLSSLRYLVWGATPISKDVAETVTRRTGVRWLHVYGTSEHGQLAANPVTEPARWRLDSPGLMTPDGTYRFVGEDGRDVPPHAPGELWVRSSQTMLGYLPEESNADVFVDGWVRTGDIGFVDGDGFLYLVDRSKEMIKVSGFSVSPVEIEKTLFSHPDVEDCGVYRVTDASSQERPAVAVVRRPGSQLEAQQLLDWCRERMSRYKRPVSVAFVDAIPRNPSGKVLRRRIPEVVAASLSTEPQEVAP